MRRLIVLLSLVALSVQAAGINWPIPSTQTDSQFTAAGHESALFPMSSLGSASDFPENSVATDFSIQVLAPAATGCTWNILCTNKILTRGSDLPIPDSELNTLADTDLSCLDGNKERMTYFIGFPHGSCKVRLQTFTGGTAAKFFVQGISP